LRIKDEMYGTIEFNDLERRIIDTSDFQRLRRIKQMAFTYLVYPGATHTRFEHSLGTTHLTSLISDKLGIDKDNKRKIRLYALLHDVGHVAFSHEGERALENFLGGHEKLGKRKMMEGELSDIIKENYKIEELDLSKSAEGRIIDSDLGADRMDYLQRDANNTGVAYGVIDTDRIVNKLCLEGNELCIEEGGLEAAEFLLIGRFMMFSTVYLHHTVRIAEAMLNRAIVAGIEDKTVAPEDFLSASDEGILMKLQGSYKAKKYVDALLERKLYKAVNTLEPSEELNNPETEKNLSKKFECDVLVDYPHTFFKPIDFKVKTGSGLIPITEISELVKSLKTSEEKRKKVLILCPEEYREKVIIEEFF